MISAPRGASGRPRLGTFALAGLVGAGVHAGLRADALGWRSPQSLAPLAAILLVSLAISGLQPFNIGVGQAPLAWMASLLLTALWQLYRDRMDCLVILYPHSDDDGWLGATLVRQGWSCPTLTPQTS